jgi:hypothetical protein
MDRMVAATALIGKNEHAATQQRGLIALVFSD